jgi:hypothetical protein
VINSFRGLSVTEYARLAFGGTRDPYELEQAIRGLHRTAPSESASFRHWLKAYLQSGYHPLDVITYESRTASWEERLACRDTLVLAIRQGRVSRNVSGPDHTGEPLRPRDLRGGESRPPRLGIR